MTQPEIRINKHIHTRDVYIRQADNDVIVITPDKLDGVIEELLSIQRRM